MCRTVTSYPWFDPGIKIPDPPLFSLPSVPFVFPFFLIHQRIRTRDQHIKGHRVLRIKSCHTYTQRECIFSRFQCIVSIKKSLQPAEQYLCGFIIYINCQDSKLIATRPAGDPAAAMATPTVARASAGRRSRRLPPSPPTHGRRRGPGSARACRRAAGRAR